MLRAQDVKKERCAYCARRERGWKRRLCPIHDRPPAATIWLDPYLRLWRRMRSYKALPDPGGLLDQEERMMAILDVIGEEVWRFRKLKKREADAERNANRTLGTTRPGSTAFRWTARRR